MAAAVEAGGGITQEYFDAKKREIALRMLEKADQFLEWDLKFNNHISDLAAIMQRFDRFAAPSTEFA